MHKTPYSIIYDDDDLTAVNKSSGISVNRDRWDDGEIRLDKLLSEQLSQFQNSVSADLRSDETDGKLSGDKKLFLCHRIDRDTSGLVIFAKNAGAHKRINNAFLKHEIKKTYLAIVHGRPIWKEEECNLPLLPDGNKKHLTIVDKHCGKKSTTRFRFVLSAGNYSLVEAYPETGRTHQIRVHLAALGHPVVCDVFYGPETRNPFDKFGVSRDAVYLSSFKKGWRGDRHEEKPLLARLGLHALKLEIPETAVAGGLVQGSLVLEAPLPRDMSALIKQMEKV
jgi:RluA family pseudouridine synthase